MKLPETPLLPDNMDANLKRQLTGYIKSISIKVNQLAAGFFSGNDNYATSVPTTGTWLQGDFVKKQNPVEAGGGGSKYVITGWLRITSGNGNVLNTDWVEQRVLTGN